MYCPRCRGLLKRREDVTPEDDWDGVACLNCGFIADPLMEQHKVVRPEPHRQVPHKPAKRPDRDIRRSGDRRA